MKIRRQQVEALSAASVRRFEDRLFAHVGKFFPKRCESLGEEGTRELIRYGIERAKGYGIVTERDVYKFTDVMFAYGQDFDVNPKLPWAAEILGDPREKCASTRVTRLHLAAMENAPPAEAGVSGGEG